MLGQSAQMVKMFYIILHFSLKKLGATGKAYEETVVNDE